MTAWHGAALLDALTAADLPDWQGRDGRPCSARGARPGARYGGPVDDRTFWAAPRFWILADADGNRACVCTIAGR